MIGKIIVVGLVIAGGVVYLARKRGKSHTSSCNKRNSKISSNINKQTIPIDNVDELSTEYLWQKWMSKKNANGSAPKCYLMYSAPGKQFSCQGKHRELWKMINAYTNIPSDKEVIFQVLCDPETNKVHDVHSIIFETIEPDLNTMFEQALYREGIIELEP